MTNVVVFGASGYLGRHVVRALQTHPAGWNVATPGRAVCDLVRDPLPRLEQTLRNLAPDVVIACTGLLDGATTDLVEANTLVTAKLLDALENVPARLVRIGSAGEYGAVPIGRPVREDSTAAPVGAYGASHLAATLLVEQAHRGGRVDGVTLRVFNPIGSGLNGDTVLGRAAQHIRDARASRASVVHLGSLGAYRDFVDARDVADAVVAAVDHRSPWATVNIGSGRATRVREAVRLLADVAGFRGEVVEAPVSRGRSVGVSWIQADITRAREVLGWRPQRSLAESLSEIWHDVAATKQPPPDAGPAQQRTVITATEGIRR